MQPPLLSYSLKLDDRIVRFLLQQKGLEPRLDSWCQLIEHPALEKLLVKEDITHILPKLVSEREQILLSFSGLDGTEKRQGAIALAAQLDKKLLIGDFAQLSKQGCEQQLRLLLREAYFQAG